MEISKIPNFYKNKKVFITGHSGFKGSWLAKTLDVFGAIVFGYSLKPDNELNHYDLIEFNKAGVFSDISEIYYSPKAKSGFDFWMLTGSVFCITMSLSSSL